jgi:hypothetical protein
MTQADVLHLTGRVELPDLAYDDRVRVEVVAALELDECGSCTDRIAPEQAQLCIDYAQWGHSHLRTPVCSAEHANVELTWLLRERPNPKDRPRNIRLLIPQRLVQDLPSGPLQTPEATGDQAFADLETLVRHLHAIRNPMRDGEGWDGFEAMRRLAIAAVASIGVKRIGDLEVAA